MLVWGECDARKGANVRSSRKCRAKANEPVRAERRFGCISSRVRRRAPSERVGTPSIWAWECRSPMRIVHRPVQLSTSTGIACQRSTRFPRAHLGSSDVEFTKKLTLEVRVAFDSGELLDEAKTKVCATNERARMEPTCETSEFERSWWFRRHSSRSLYRVLIVDSKYLRQTICNKDLLVSISSSTKSKNELKKKQQMDPLHRP